jgi:hypothetical protein
MLLKHGTPILPPGIAGRFATFRETKSLLFLLFWALEGCFGPPTMKYDIAAYNKNIVQSETEMLLYNIGRLADKQQPHFMMLSSVSQGRTFQANAGFQWSHVASMLNPMTTWQAGPFSTTTTESPTITFVPIQGPDFAQRFESPLREKFTLFLEDKWWSANPADYTLLTKLLAQSLYLYHPGRDLQGKCKPSKPGGKRDRSVLYVNRQKDPRQDLSDTSGFNTPDYYYEDFSDCVSRIVNDPHLYIVLIDGHNPVPTVAAADPTASDAVTALQQSYEWTKPAKEYALTTPVKVPAFLDYDPRFVAADPWTPTAKVLDSLSAPWWHLNSLPKLDNLLYTVPKGYSWKWNSESDGKDTFVYVLVPDGYKVKKVDARYVLVPDGFVPKRAGANVDCKKTPEYSLAATDKQGAFNLKPVDCKGPVAGELYTLFSEEENLASYDTKLQAALAKKQAEERADRLSYSDTIVRAVEPVPQDYVYVELRQNSDVQAPDTVDNDAAKKACFEEPIPPSDAHVMCGYFKISNLLDVLTREADMACRGDDLKNPGEKCVFGIGNYFDIPSWADNYAQIGANKYTGLNQYIWEPVHGPSDPIKYKRDRQVFAMIYKLYQTSLVDTSKLVTGAPIVTIPTK